MSMTDINATNAYLPGVSVSPDQIILINNSKGI